MTEKVQKLKHAKYNMPRHNPIDVHYWRTL
jgi:hypothetical protein